MGMMVTTSCEVIKVLVEGSERNLSYYIDKLKEFGGRDWSPETLAMRDLEHSSRVLRILAAEIDNAREAMIQHERIGT